MQCEGKLPLSKRAPGDEGRVRGNLWAHTPGAYALLKVVKGPGTGSGSQALPSPLSLRDQR